MLLEKPIAPNEAEVRGLIEAANKHKRIVMICHVLRYAPFYQRVKQLLDSGAIGKIIAFTTTESINYHHMTTPFVRGRS
jgi:predicted dehydrogenase